MQKDMPKIDDGNIIIFRATQRDNFSPRHPLKTWMENMPLSIQHNHIPQKQAAAGSHKKHVYCVRGINPLNFKNKGGISHSHIDNDALNILYIHLSKKNSIRSPGGNDITLLERHYQFFPLQKEMVFTNVAFTFGCFPSLSTNVASKPSDAYTSKIERFNQFPLSRG